MSRIKEMTREVIREGEDRRATFAAQGMPLRIYAWWYRHTKRRVVKENFCHYCRVVAIWAPLMFIRMMLAKLFGDRQFWICIALASAAIVVGAGIAYPDVVGVVLVGLVVLCIAIAGLIIGFALAFYLQDKNEFDDVPKWAKITSATLVLPALPTVVAGLAIGGLVSALISRLAKRFYYWMGNARLIKGRVSPFGVFLLLVAGFIFALSVVGNWWIIPLAVLALIAAVYAGKWAIEWFGYRLAQRRKERRLSAELAASQRSLAALEPVLRMIFNHFHSEAQDEEAYWDWRRDYVARAEERGGKFVWIDIYNNAISYQFPDWGRWDHSLIFAIEEKLERLREERWQSKRQIDQQREVFVKKVASPFTVMGDFIILLAQFIRVSKWKICPVVELPKDL